MSKFRASADDIQTTAAYYQASAGRLAGGTSTGAGQSFQPTAAAVRAVQTGAAVTRAALSARTAATGFRVAAGDARYLQNETESAAKLHAVCPQVV